LPVGALQAAQQRAEVEHEVGEQPPPGVGRERVLAAQRRPQRVGREVRVARDDRDRP
jgi:hypothetical protein